MVGDRRPAVSLVFTSAPPPTRIELLGDSGWRWLLPSRVVRLNHSHGLRRGGGAPSLDRRVFLGIVDVLDSLCECVPPHCPRVSVSLCYLLWHGADKWCQRVCWLLENATGYLKIRGIFIVLIHCRNTNSYHRWNNPYESLLCYLNQQIRF